MLIDYPFNKAQFGSQVFTNLSNVHFQGTWKFQKGFGGVREFLGASKGVSGMFSQGFSRRNKALQRVSGFRMGFRGVQGGFGDF